MRGASGIAFPEDSGQHFQEDLQQNLAEEFEHRPERSTRPRR